MPCVKVYFIYELATSPIMHFIAQKLHLHLSPTHDSPAP